MRYLVTEHKQIPEIMPYLIDIRMFNKTWNFRLQTALIRIRYLKMHILFQFSSKAEIFTGTLLSRHNIPHGLIFIQSSTALVSRLPLENCVACS